jgi:hypothetical protein
MGRVGQDRDPDTFENDPDPWINDPKKLKTIRSEKINWDRRSTIQIKIGSTIQKMIRSLSSKKRIVGLDP